MSQSTVGLRHRGAMGVTVGAAAGAAGARAVWASAGRSEATRHRASQAGLEDVETLSELAHLSEVIISVCPPDAAVDVASGVAPRQS